MRKLRLSSIAVAMIAVFILLLGTVGQAFACTGLERDDNLHLATTVRTANLTPVIGVTLGVDKSTAVPGDTLTYTALVTNSGVSLVVTGQISAKNESSRTATVGSWFDYISYDPKGKGGDRDDDGYGHDRDRWIPIAGAAGAAAGHSPAVKPPLSTGMTFAATPIASSDVTYAAGADKIDGTQIGRDATARWSFTATIPLTAAQAAALIKGSAALPIRTNFHAEAMTGTRKDSDEPTVATYDFYRELTALGTGAATNIVVTIALPNKTAATVTIASVAPGASAPAKFTYKVPAPAAKGAAETDAAYLARLAALDGSQLTATATARAGCTGQTAGPSAPVATTEHLPILSLAKTGPARVDAGKSAAYELALANTGSAPAAALTLTDSLPDGTVIAVTGTPATLAPAATATAHSAYAVPAQQPAGSLTDIATLRWTDANGNAYGPISSQATTTVTRSISTVTVTASSGSLTYGGSIPAITPAYSGWQNGDGPAVLTTAPTCTATATSAAGVGTYKTSCSGAVAPNYTFVYVDGSITVTPITVTVTALSGSFAYGGTVPVIAPAYSGWLAGEGPSVLTKAPACTTTATSTSGAGTYKTSCTGAVAHNYVFVYVDGSMEVGPALVTVTASSDSMTYGGTVPAITAGYSGWQNGDDPSVLTTAPACTTVATSASPAGTYKTSCTGAAAANYTFGYVEGTISVNPSVVIVTASSGSLTYGGTVSAITPAYSGWVNGDGPSVLTTAPTCSTTATSAAGVGTYTTSCTGAVATNYTFTYADGTITVTPALVTVTAPSGSFAYGGTVPAIAPAYSGWVNGEGPSVLTTAPTCTTTATGTSGAGTYKTTCSGAAAPNYTFDYVDGSVKVTPALVTVTASSGSMLYGATVPVITPSYSGWVNGDDASVITTAPACTTAATSASPAGTYSSSCAGAAAANYTFAYVDGTISVNGITITGLTLSPQSAGPLPVGSSHTFTVTATDSNGQPASGAAITLTVAGPNATTANLTTDATGTATFTYTGANSGTDVAQAVLVSQPSMASNTASVAWVAPAETSSTTTVHGQFFTNYPYGDPFSTVLGDTPLWEQDFPTINFDPLPGTVANDPSGVNQFTRPFTNITTDVAGNYTGTVPAQGNGYQAGIGDLNTFNAVFTGSYTIAAAGDYAFDVISDDAFILGIANGATPLPGNVWVNPPASGLTPMHAYPIMGTFNHNTGPQPNTVNVHFPAPGVYPYEIDYSEVWPGSSMCLSVRMHGTGHGVNPSGTIAMSPAVTSSGPVGSSKTYTVAVMGAAGTPIANLPLAVHVTGANPQVIAVTTDTRGLASFTYVGYGAGTDQLQVYAVLDGMPAVSNTVAMSWLQTGAAVPPVIGAVAPADGTIITAPTPITASFTPPDGQTITSWQVTYTRQGTSSSPVVLASGSGTPPPTLATFDPTLLPNGGYTIAVSGFASGGGGLSTSANVVVSGNLKLGRYGVTYQDANVAVGGIPMQVQRTYDSFDKSTGAFGVGWQLSVANFRVYTNGPLGAGGWSSYDKWCALSICEVAWTTSHPHFVTVVWPDGHTEMFDLTPGGGSNIFYYGSASFTARPGSTSTLAVAGDATLNYTFDGNLYTPGSSGFFNPTSFTLTAKDGTAYVLDTVSGLVSATDPTGNKISVDSAGIHSSLGPSITFVRDGAGRISELDKPDGTKLTYAYDAAGDLVSVTDERGKTVTYEYDSAHNLTKTIDPNGHPFETVAYDADGRISSITDATGNTTAVSSDPNTRTERVTDATGQKVTLSSFNTAGDLVRVDTVADGKTATTIYAYDANHNVTSRTDPAGGVWAATYDDTRNLTSVTDANGAKVALTYDAFGHPLTWTDPNGGVTSYHWNTNGTLASITDALGNDETYLYDTAGNMTSRTDREGHVWTYAYDAAGHLSTTTDQAGHATTYAYDGAGRLLTSTDPLTHKTTYEYDLAGNLTKTTNAAGEPTSYTYDALGFLATTTDPAGKVTTYGRDSAGRVTSVTDPTGAVTHTTYDAAGRVATTTDAAGNTTTYGYDGAGNQISMKDPLGRTTTSSYDPRGLKLTSTNAAGGVTHYAYDAAGNATSVTDPNGRVSSSTYGPHGELLTSTDPAGAKTTYAFDLLGRTTKVTDPAGAATTTAYDRTGNVSSVIDPAGAVTAYGYDTAGRQITVTDANGSVTTYGYSTAGQMTSVADALGNASSSVFDATGRLKTYTSAAGVATNYAYDSRGRTTTITDSLGHSTSYTYDDAGRTLTSTDPRGYTTTFAYDTAGRQNKITDALGHSVAFGYDTAGQQTSLTDADGKIWQTTYDALGNVATTTDPLGNVTTYTHDTAGVLTSKTDGRGITTTYGYDTAGRLASLATPSASITTTYDSAGRRSTMTDPTGKTTYGYDTAGRLASVAAPASTVAYTYDPAGNRATMTAAGKTTAYTYDPAERLATVSRPDLGTFTFAYNADGQLSTLTRPNGITSTEAYDAAGRQTGPTYKNPGGTTIAAYTYTLDQAGNRTAATTAGIGTDAYTLDAAGRLTAVTYADGTSATFTYDAAGNRTSMTSGGTTTAYTYNDASELTSAGSTAYTYDGAGNRLTAGSTSYGYDSFGNLASQAAGAVSIAYRSNGDGLRVTATSGGAGTAYTWDEAAGLPSLLSDGTTDYVSADATLLAETSASTSAYPLTDALGSIRAATDASGSVTASATYGAYGNIRSSSGSVGSLGYTGGLTDASGLVYLQARSLDTSTGTFTARDPMTPGGPGVTGFNPYAYAGQNPSTYTDPSGRTMPESGAVSMVGGLSWPIVAFTGGALVSEFLVVALSLLLVYEMTQTLPRTLAPNAPTDIPWDKIGRDIQSLTEAIAKTIVAICAGSFIGTQLAGFLGRSADSICGGDHGPVFLSGGDTLEATNHDAAVIVPSHLDWATLTHASYRFAKGWYTNKQYGDPCAAAKARAAHPNASGQQCDEYPFRSTAEGGPGLPYWTDPTNPARQGASIEYIDGSDNMIQGGIVSAFYTACSIPKDSGNESKFLVIPLATIPLTMWNCGSR